MIQQNKIDELEKYNNSKFPILSVYLGSDSLQSPSEKFLLTQFHSLIHQQLNSDQRNLFEKDIKKIEEYLDHYIPSDRTLVIFSAGKKLWEIIDLEFSIPANVSVNTSPNVDLMLRSLQKYSRYLVLLVDREKARMFTVEQGRIMEHSDFVGGYVPQNKKLTGRDGAAGRGDMISRHTNELLDRHIELSCKAADKFIKSQDISFLILGGHAEMLAKVTESLPTNLKDKLVGGFIIDVNSPINDILIESKRIAATI